MNEYERLIAWMKILYHNLTTLHRNLVRDEAWFANHKQISKWYEEIGDEIDDLAETGIALGYREPSISEAVLAFSGDVLTTEPRRLDETYRLILEYFRELAGMMQATEAIVPANVQFLSTPSGWRATAKTDKVFVCFCAKGRRICLFKTRKEKNLPVAF